MSKTVINKPRPNSFWRRCLDWITALEDGMDTSHAELQDRRIERIEADLLKLRLQVLDLVTPSEQTWSEKARSDRWT